MKDYFFQLFEHEYWANLSVLEMYFKSRNPSERATILMSHVIATQRVWLDRLKGNEMVVNPFEVFEDEALLELLEINYIELLRLIDEADFEQLFTYQNTEDKQFTKNTGNTLTHLALHASYHRGQLVTLLKSDENPAVEMGFIHYGN
ncbi:MAG: putative damage-inducible protein DinB [Spirosomataceae bacterium]|jgi:uncharacterized damage-inducible protein DinB